MKTSITLPGLLLGLVLAFSAWAQEDADNQADSESQDPAPETQQGGEEASENGAPAEPVAEEAAEEPENPDPAPETQQSGEEASESDAPAEPAAEEAAGPPEETDGAAESQETAAEESPTSQANDAAMDPSQDTEAADPTTGAEAEPTMPPTDAPSDSAEMFTFQGHPIFGPETAELVYQPLVNYLNDALPYRFDLELSPDYHRYWLSTRRGESSHLVLEEPHLTAYRIEEYNYTPLVRADQSITYSLLTSMDNAESSVSDFIGQRISTMPAPSLGYLILASWFDNPMQQPMVQSNANSWLDAVEIVFSQEADAAIVPHNLVSRYVNMANVLTSQEFPGVTVAASPDVPADIQEEIRAALLILHEDEEHFVALNELDIDQFIEAEPSEYEGLEQWLSLVYSVL